jgi:L-seryl-tRNA(Ser) seleniumtransferase
MSHEQHASPFPSVDRLARNVVLETLAVEVGRAAVIESIRAVLDARREESSQSTRTHQGGEALGESQLVETIVARVRQRTKPTLRRVFNLTGTVLHTNLGRAQLSGAAIQAAGVAMREPCNLEFDLLRGSRGERDHIVEPLLTELTGAEAATVVNNNAAAVLLVLAALAYKREVVISRGELIEIGGSFRIPDILRSAGAKLVEVGTTNRTHAADYEESIRPATAALMKVHASNYRIDGFVATVPVAEVAAIAHARELPLIVDLGAGSLVDLAAYGLPKEPVVRDSLTAGSDVVTFSGDKLLGGPQAGLIVGKKSLIESIRRHPLKRALRVSKMTLAALEATLIAYRAPDRLMQELPTLRWLTRPQRDIEAQALRLQSAYAAALGAAWQVNALPMSSQVGSGSLPTDLIPSFGLAATAAKPKSGAALKKLAGWLQQLPIPVIGRIADNQLLLDLRCLDDEGGFLEQLQTVSERT